MNDILPDEVGEWRRVEAAAREACERYGYREIRLPLFEATELYVRGIGEVTDIVEKEMFRVSGPATAAAGERDAESFSLRPEFTAGVVRAYREHGLDKTRGFLKVYSIGPLFRFERPQRGRARQFHQVNVEALGSSDPRVDVETIALARDIIESLGIPDFRVRLNSIGHEADDCRGAYRAMLRGRIEERLGTLCDLCRARYERNVFRVLDCKRCAERTADLPPMAEHLCPGCAEHFAAVRAGLERSSLPFAIDARLVRGFDYYTRTVFEFPSERLGAQDAMGGGGRYDRLIPDFGGPDAGACGLALGIERLLLARGPAAPGGGRRRAVFVASLPDGRSRAAALDVAQRLRRGGVEADLDLEGRSLGAQMKRANRDGFGWVAIIGEDEIAREEVTLKDMTASTQAAVRWADLVGALRAAGSEAERP